MDRLHVNQDVLAGLIFTVFGSVVLILSRQYSFGTLLRMDSGFMPTVLGALLLGIGAFIGIKGALSEGEPLTRWSVKPLIFVPTAFLAFAFLVERFGLVIAGTACMLIAAAGGHEFKLREQLILAVCSVAIAAMGFIYLLGLPMSYWPQFRGMGF